MRLYIFLFLVRVSAGAPVCDVCDCRPLPENRNLVVVTCTTSYRARREEQNGESGEMGEMGHSEVEDGFFNTGPPKVLTAPLIDFPHNFPNATSKGT